MTRRRILAWLAVAYVGMSAAGGAYFVDRSLHRTHRPTKEADRVQAAALATSLAANLDTVSIESRDGAALRAWHFSPTLANSHSVLILHGIGANRAAMLESVPLFVEQGYRVLVIDLRGHGDSGGDLSTFGVLEGDDVARWIAWLQRAAPNACVYTFGGSLGAGLAVQAANTPGLCAVVADSVFDSLRETAFDRIGQQSHTGLWLGRTVLRPGVELGFLYARLRYGINLGEPSAAASAAHPGAPILLIHGLDDDTSAPRQARMIQAANPARVSLWLVPGAGHGGARRTAPVEYQDRVLGFLALHRTPNRTADLR